MTKLSEMKWMLATYEGDVLAAHIVGSGNYYEFRCKGGAVLEFRTRCRYGRRVYGNWSNWTPPERVANPEFWAAVRARLAEFRAEESEWTGTQ